MNKLVGFITVALVMCSVNSNASPTFGGRLYSATLRPGESYSTAPISLNRNELTSVEAYGDGDGDIDCFLVDELGNIVGSDNDSQDNCVIEVVPRWTGAFRLFIKNEGHMSDVFHVVIR
jgi:hypothetical protein